MKDQIHEITNRIEHTNVVLEGTVSLLYDLAFELVEAGAPGDDKLASIIYTLEKVSEDIQSDVESLIKLPVENIA